MEWAGISITDSYYTIVDKAVAWMRSSGATLTYALAEPTETDIDTSAFNHLIEVEAGGYVEIITNNGKVVPTTFIFQTIQ